MILSDLPGSFHPALESFSHLKMERNKRRSHLSQLLCTVVGHRHLRILGRPYAKEYDRDTLVEYRVVA